MGTESEVEAEYLYYMGFEANNPTFLEDAVVTEEFSVLPRYCYNTNELIWLRRGVRARRFYTSITNKIQAEDRWYDPVEFTLLQLKLL